MDEIRLAVRVVLMTQRRALEMYQYLGPLVLAPLSLYLWWQSYRGPLAVLAWGVPIVWSYLVPGVGTNLLRTWEFDVRLRWGRFRPQHGFVFGSATSILAWLVHPTAAHGWLEVMRWVLILTCVLGWLNLLYDVVALRSGILKVYNQPWAEGRGPEAVALDYAPWFFGGFGGSYALALGYLELSGEMSWNRVPAVFLGMLVFTVLVPVLGYTLQSRRRHGHWGIYPVRKSNESSLR